MWFEMLSEIGFKNGVNIGNFGAEVGINIPLSGLIAPQVFSSTKSEKTKH
jgi:hypothetical protein